jgi:tetratricopeptide (TPR) repeat protein
MAVDSGTQVEAQNRRVRSEQVVLLVCGALALLWQSTGCAPTPAQKAEADIRSVRSEANAKTLVERGKAFAAVGDHTRAEEYLASGLDAGADPRDVLPLLMDVCVKTGRYRSAIQHGENHLRKHPHDLQTRVMVGALYAAINEGKQAREQLEHVVKADTASAKSSDEVVSPKIQAQAHYLLGVVARDSESDAVEADRHFREYLRIEPNGSHADEAKSSLLKRVPEPTPTPPNEKKE